MRACKKNSVQKIKVFLRFLKCDSATPCKPCVQNYMRVKSKMDEEPSSLNDASTNCMISVPMFFSTILILTAWWNRWNAVFQKRILPPTNPSPWDNTSKIPSIKPLSIGTTRSQQTDSSVLTVDEFIEKSKWVRRKFWGFSRKFWLSRRFESSPLYHLFFSTWITVVMT